jgi:hypothetical protein
MLMRNLMPLVVDYSRRHGQVVTRTDVLRLGGNTAQITAIVRAGVLVRAHPGVFVLAGAHRDPTVATRAALAAATRPALVSHLSAAWLLGIRDRPPSLVHITSTAHRRSINGIVMHRTQTVPFERRVIQGVPCTAPARTLVDIATLLTPALLADAVDRALGGRMLRANDLIAETDRRPPRPGNSRLRRALVERGLTGPSASVLESRMARLQRTYDLPAAQPELIAGPNGEYRIDYAYPGPRVAVELYGYMAHHSPEQMAHDLNRQRRLTLDGWTVLVFTWRDVTDRPAQVAHDIQNALRLALSVDSQPSHRSA